MWTLWRNIFAGWNVMFPSFLMFSTTSSTISFFCPFPIPLLKRFSTRFSIYGYFCLLFSLDFHTSYREGRTPWMVLICNRFSLYSYIFLTNLPQASRRTIFLHGISTDETAECVRAIDDAVGCIRVVLETGVFYYWHFLSLSLRWSFRFGQIGTQINVLLLWSTYSFPSSLNTGSWHVYSAGDLIPGGGWIDAILSHRFECVAKERSDITSAEREILEAVSDALWCIPRTLAHNSRKQVVTFTNSMRQVVETENLSSEVCYSSWVRSKWNSSFGAWSCDYIHVECVNLRRKNLDEENIPFFSFFLLLLLFFFNLLLYR